MDETDASSIDWYKRIGAEYAKRLEEYDKDRCVNCFRVLEGPSHACDQRKQKLAEVISATVASTLPELRTPEQLWVLAKVAETLLTKYLTKVAHHRRNASKTGDS